MNFVTRDSSTGWLMVDGQRCRFAGPNVIGFGLTNYASLYGAPVDSQGYHLPSHSEIDDILNQAGTMNATSIRAYGAVMSVGRISSVQPTLGSFNPAAMEPVDYMLHQCHLRGIRVYFPLVDAWDYQPRGAPWYCTANGMTPDGNASQFYNLANTAVVNSFKAHISYVLDHVNVYTGVAYKDDPTILCWETGNELHAGGWTSANVAWTGAISEYIKVTKAAQQLVMDGAGTNFPTGDGGEKDIDLPYVDIYSRHAYDSGTNPAELALTGEEVHAHGKAFVVGEFTWNGKNSWGTTLTWTLDQFTAGMEAAYCVDGDNFWQLLPTRVGVGGPSIFGLHSPGDNSDMTTRVGQLSTHASNMTNMPVSPPPPPPPSPSTLLDTFTDVNGKKLVGSAPHIGEVGASWTNPNFGDPWGATIQDNRAWVSSPGGSICVADAALTSADYPVTGTFRLKSVITHHVGFVVGRYQAVSGAGNTQCYAAEIACNTWQIRIVKYTNGWRRTTLAWVGIPALAVGSDHTITLHMVGNQISAVFDETTTLGPVTDNTYTTRGKAGFGSHSGSSSTTGLHLDKITAG